MPERLLALHNGEATPVGLVPLLSPGELREIAVEAVAQGMRVAALFATGPDEVGARVWLVLAEDRAGKIRLGAMQVAGRYLAWTTACPQAHCFERALWEEWGIIPEGHPWLKLVRFQRALGDARAAPPPVGLVPYYAMEGEEIHEVAVGPVHAGIIEPGHFRFQAHGETAYHLEISLGYQHRGIQRALRGGPSPKTVHYFETVAGDTTVGHTLAYAQAIEALTASQVSARALSLRGIGLELERLANHTGDLGALAGDVGFLPALAYCGRIRGDFLNMTAAITGNRFGRGLIRPGGVGQDIDLELTRHLGKRLEIARRDLDSAVPLLFETSSVRARFEETGYLTASDCRSLGVVGVACRAAGLERDVRFDLPTGIYQFRQIPVSSWKSGDVFARAYVRWLEVQRSLAFVQDELKSLPQGDPFVAYGPLSQNSLVVSLVEGWRGEVCHIALTDAAGHFRHYEIVDPSFHNWAGLALAMRGQQISDFPLCNKSFNLSYCGHDL